MRVLKFGAAATAAAGMLAAAGAASSAIMISSGSFGSAGGVHSVSGLDAATVTGTVGPGGDLVTLSQTGGNKLKTSGGGESTFTGDPTLNNLEIAFSKTYSEVTFNVVGLKQNSTLTLSVDNGLQSFTEAISKNGQNKFTVTATGSNTISELHFSFSNDVQDVRQIRVMPAGGVPEPATWAMLIFGLAGIGAAMRRRSPAVA